MSGNGMRNTNMTKIFTYVAASVLFVHEDNSNVNPFMLKGRHIFQHTQWVSTTNKMDHNYLCTAMQTKRASDNILTAWNNNKHRYSDKPASVQNSEDCGKGNSILKQ